MANPEKISPLALAQQEPAVKLSGKLQKYQKYLTKYKIPLPKGCLLVLPVVRGFEGISWDIRLHGKGIVGPLSVTDEHVLMLGGSVENLAEAEAIREILTKEFSKLPAPERIKISDELKKQLA
jgi:hypothetical protein